MQLAYEEVEPLWEHFGARKPGFPGGFWSWNSWVLHEKPRWLVENHFRTAMIFWILPPNHGALEIFPTSFDKDTAEPKPDKKRHSNKGKRTAENCSLIDLSWSHLCSIACFVDPTRNVSPKDSHTNLINLPKRHKQKDIQKQVQKKKLVFFVIIFVESTRMVELLGFGWEGHRHGEYGGAGGRLWQSNRNGRTHINRITCAQI